MVCVNWHDARAYVDWVSRVSGKQYRLLSESEWEYAARAGTTGPFHTGPTISVDEANGNIRSLHYGRNLPVGSFAANGFGLHDVHGNVCEWVQDCWNETYQGAPRDGSVWEVGECLKRVKRGGSSVNGQQHLRSAFRYGDGAKHRSYISGFRVARTF